MDATLLVCVLVIAVATIWFCMTYVAWREQKQAAFIQGALAGFAAGMVLNAWKHEAGRPNHFVDVFTSLMEQVSGRKASRSPPFPRHSPPSSQ